MAAHAHGRRTMILVGLFLGVVSVAFSATDPKDLAVLKQFRDGLSNPELLQWPDGDNDPCGSRWKHVFCSGTRVSQIQVQNLGLKGPLPSSLNQLNALTDLGLQKNSFTGPIPSFSGLSALQKAYLDYNSFNSIPSDFFTGLDSLQFLALDGNALNSTAGWMFPDDLRNSAQLMNLTCNQCNLAGPLPDYLGSMASLSVLMLAGNSLSGQIPSSFANSSLEILWLNNQVGGGMTGPITVVASMGNLRSLWLHGNSFSGPIPSNIGDLVSLKDLNMNGNQLVGVVPDSLVNMELDSLNLNNNHLMGPTPKFKAGNSSCAANFFCLPSPGVPCNPQVMALIGFLDGVNYPSRLLNSWEGNDPCKGPWLGVGCGSNGKVSMINLPKNNLSGTLSPSVADLADLSSIRLSSNNLTGSIPASWTSLKSLTYLDLSNNDILPPLPKFSTSVKLMINGNPVNGDGKSVPAASPQSSTSPSGSGSPTGGGSSSSPTKGSGSTTSGSTTGSSKPKKLKPILVAIVAPVASLAVLIFLAVPLYFFCKKRKEAASQAPNSLVVYPRDPSDPDNIVKIAVASNTYGSTSLTGSGSQSRNSSGRREAHVIEAGNLVISVQVLRNVTKNFAPDNELGRGGFGVVYKGELDDGTKIAVKRMEAGVISNKALDEFQAEIAVLSKVRHRHLVSLLGYSTEGNERILVYEYMPQGALSKHLFHWKTLKLEPLSWKRRLNIALDVARGMEYLHSLAHQSFIHRDLKSSNILLGDDFKAKVSDFGLVKLAPDGEKSVVTRLAGTFGYLAPEYAVTGKITTKADVFSFGVVLMELLTGLMALDEERSEETQYLVGYFWNIKSNKEKLMAAIDPVLDRKEETFESIATISELAGHCTAREPGQRPDMSHAVNVLAPLVEKWKPIDDETEEYSGIDYSLPLNQMVKDWQEAEGKDLSYMDLDDSKGSIPARPTGFADSFTSTDAR
ncbi:receptor protein kinase TMK1-like [Punica granatum]|uniref:non-specific serine/threonine protein kinase n=1 Tax=Punica granatum TaxID=22663 RepID=A0A218XDL9_PUNGR|nr:receptor protein kinase TMK1-like [Punica granatum]OWM82581.1 hypothetical protein CDL15_Pgr002156 [Punica granatum]